MAQRITEDIRFYLPADPYYYQVDNLPIEDLLANDIRLQSQIDEINAANRGLTVGREGFTELQPFIDPGLPGTISVRSGNFIGRVQRSNYANMGGGTDGSTMRYRIDNGIAEMNGPPDFGSGENPTGDYNVHNYSQFPNDLGAGVGRTALITFKEESISIDGFNFNDFQNLRTHPPLVTPPLGRIDLIGIGTMNGAMDDPYLPGNPGADAGGDIGVWARNNPNLSVVKGAGIIAEYNSKRVVKIGERYITIGTPQEHLNDYGRNLQGSVVPNPEFGTTPLPDDVVNVSFARSIVENGQIVNSLRELGQSNKNANFFLPIAYVFVPQSHVEGNPIPEEHLRDIRPFFRTAELSLDERQAMVGAVIPSLRNPFVTEKHLTKTLMEEVARLDLKVNTMRGKLRALNATQTVYIPPVLVSENIKEIETLGAQTWNISDFGIPAGAYGLIIRTQIRTHNHKDSYRYILARLDTSYGWEKISAVNTSWPKNRDRGEEIVQTTFKLRQDGQFSAYLEPDPSGGTHSMTLWIDGYIMKTDFESLAP